MAVKRVTDITYLSEDEKMKSRVKLVRFLKQSGYRYNFDAITNRVTVHLDKFKAL